MTTPADLSTYRCPACGHAATDSTSRTCPSCGYCGDWVQPGETLTYAARKAWHADRLEALEVEANRAHLRALAAHAAWLRASAAPTPAAPPQNVWFKLDTVRLDGQPLTQSDMEELVLLVECAISQRRAGGRAYRLDNGTAYLPHALALDLADLASPAVVDVERLAAALAVVP
jgi:hypothetical protein